MCNRVTPSHIRTFTTPHNTRMHYGKLIAVGGASDACVSPTPSAMPTSTSPVATPRVTCSHVGLSYFIFLMPLPSSEWSTSHHQHQPSGSSSKSAKAPGPADCVCVISIENISGGLMFQGVPNVDMFKDEAAALLALPGKVSLAPDSLRVTVLCQFEAWCGAYVTEEHLHLLFVMEKTRVSGGSGSTGQDDIAFPSDILRADRVQWRSIRLQCPQQVFGGPRVPSGSPTTSHQAPPPYYDDPKSGTESHSNVSVDGDRPLDMTMPSIFFGGGGGGDRGPSSDPMMLQDGSPRTLTRGLFYSPSFDLTHPESTYQAVAATTVANGTPSWIAMSTPLDVLFNPDTAMSTGECLWNNELIRFCHYFGVGDFCVRLMFGSVQIVRSSRQQVSLGLVSRLSRASYRGTLAVDFASAAGEGQASLLMLAAATNTSSIASLDDESVLQTIEAHLPMEHELQLLTRSASKTPTKDSSQQQSIPVEEQTSVTTTSTIWYRGQGTLCSDTNDASGFANGRRLLQRARQSRNASCSSSLVDCVVPANKQQLLASSMRPTATPTSPPAVLNASRGWESSLQRLMSESTKEEHLHLLQGNIHDSHPPSRLRRCCIADERQIPVSMLVILCWGLDALLAHDDPRVRELVSLDVQRRTMIDDMMRDTSGGSGLGGNEDVSSIVYLLCSLCFEESATLFQCPLQSSREVIRHCMDFLRDLHNASQQLRQVANNKGSASTCSNKIGGETFNQRGGFIAMDDDAFWTAVYANAAQVVFTEPMQVHAIDHRYASFLQALVDHPRAHNRVQQNNWLLSDPNHGCHVIKASVMPQTDGTATSQAQQIPLQPSTNGNAEDRSLAAPSLSSAAPHTPPALTSPHGIPLPPFVLIRSVLMPKSPSIYCPEGYDSITFTVALPSMSRVSFIGLLVPSTLQETMFAAPLCLTLSSSEYYNTGLERVHLQNAILPLAVGNTTTLSSVMVVFPLGELFYCSASPLVAGVGNGAAGTTSTTTSSSSSRLIVGGPSSRTSMLPTPTSNVGVIGRYFTVTLRASGKSPLLVPNVFLFGQELCRMPVQHLRTLVHTSSAPTVATTHPAPSSSVALTPSEDVKRFLLEEYTTLRPLDGGLRPKGRANSNFNVHLDPQASAPTFTLQTGEKFRVNENQRRVLLHSRMIERVNFRGRSPSPIMEGVDDDVIGEDAECVAAVDRRPSPARSPTEHVSVMSAYTFQEFVSKSEVDPYLPGVQQRYAIEDKSPTVRSRSETPIASQLTAGVGGGLPPTVSPAQVEALSIEEEYLAHLRELVPPERAMTLTLHQVLSLELTRLKLGLSRAARDRCCYRAGYPCWVFDPSSHVFPRSISFDPSTSRKDRGSACQRCKSRLTFLSKKRECVRCGDTLCVKCTVDHPVRLLELGIKDPTAMVCAACLTEASKIETTLVEWLRMISGGASEGPPSLKVQGVRPHRVPGTLAMLRHRGAADSSITLLPPANPFPTSSRASIFKSCVALPRDVPYNLCIANVCQVISDPRALTAAAIGVQTAARHNMHVERILGDVALPGRGWHCVGHDEVGPSSLPTQRTVAIAFPGPVDIDELRIECVRHGILSKPPIRRQDKKVTVSLYLAESLSQFNTLALECSTADMQLIDAQAGVWCVVGRVNTQGGSGGPTSARLVVLKFSGLVQDLCDLELLHLSLWGRFVMSTGIDTMMLNRLSFGGNGGYQSGACLSSALRYSLRNGISFPVEHTPSGHHRLSIISHATSSPGLPGSSSQQHQNNGALLLPKTLHKARPLSCKSVQVLTQCTTSHTVEYDFGNAMTVCGIIIEHHHPSLCTAHRIATTLRFSAVGSDGRRGNIAVLQIPIALPPQPSSHMMDGQHTSSAVEPLSMSFAFPSSSHDVRVIHVEVMDWRWTTTGLASAVAPSVAGGAATSTTGGSSSTLSASSTSTSAVPPFMGKLTFWSSPDAHTRRIVSSGAYFSVFSSNSVVTVASTGRSQSK